ncbi:Interferon-induced GTP-binding protein mx2 [Pyrenophora tritici-repentis]|nr:Interferon-induced GTP-binding protein mx2 [Pyrenophora tritici-repentis]
MLKKIDSLFACGSSGKSSVLEGLIKKLLPRDSGLCTRLATQIIFRREAREQAVVSIIPDQHASIEHSNRVKGWGRTISSLDSDTFKEIMQEEHLSVIDVPGIFKSTTEGVTTKADIQLVRNMEILELAAEADVHGDRTLGVLTKPDLVDRGAEPGVVDLVEGRARQMKLGWHIIRNPGQKDLQDMSMDRGDLEAAFFRSSAPWSSIEKGKIGIDSLRLRVKEVLSSLVKKECPKVQAEIKGRLASCRRQLNGLGLEQNTSA